MATFASNRLLLSLLLSITPQNFQLKFYYDIICDNVSVVVCVTMQVIKVLNIILCNLLLLCFFGSTVTINVIVMGKQ